MCKREHYLQRPEECPVPGRKSGRQLLAPQCGAKKQLRALVRAAPGVDSKPPLQPRLFYSLHYSISFFNFYKKYRIIDLWSFVIWLEQC